MKIWGAVVLILNVFSWEGISGVSRGEATDGRRHMV